MHNIYYTPEAEENLVNIFSYISEDNAFEAAKVLVNIKNSIDILKLFPFAWKIIDDDFRILIETKYKFKIVYKIKNNSVFIVSIFKYQDMWS